LRYSLMPSWEAIWCRSLKGLRSRVDISVMLVCLSCYFLFFDTGVLLKALERRTFF